MTRGEALRGLVQSGGVLLTCRALEAGWTPRSLLRALAAEGWTRITPGAWAEPGRDVTLFDRVRAAQLRKPELVASHRTAAALWRIETLGSPGTESLVFTDPELATRRDRKRGSTVRVHRASLAPREAVTRWGLRLTIPSRTLVDLLRTEPRDEALVAVDSALSRRTVAGVRRAPLLRLTDLAAALEAPRRGGAAARGHLHLADPHAGSPAETIARLRMHDAGLHPESQAELRTPDGRRRFLDFLFRAQGLAVEIEGYAYHGTRAAHRDDIARFNQVLQCPEVRLLLRCTATDVFHRPAKMIEEIRAALAQAATGMP
ncbi:hypothetical protein [Streptomyces sp. NPDC005485]|uniref:hypothetical protein n=1 Tax=Streptomyces sp. NPDC005485 TaxID=3155591 RepID=UPI0033AA1A26